MYISTEIQLIIYENIIHNLILKAHKGFNSRDIDTALATFHTDVQYSKSFKGGYVERHNKIRTYWTSQWSEINSTVKPLNISELSDGRLEVKVHQFVKDL